jgi:hypothetical protein
VFINVLHKLLVIFNGSTLFARFVILFVNHYFIAVCVGIGQVLHRVKNDVLVWCPGMNCLIRHLLTIFGGECKYDENNTD